MRKCGSHDSKRNITWTLLDQGIIAYEFRTDGWPVERRALDDLLEAFRRTIRLLKTADKRDAEGVGCERANRERQRPRAVRIESKSQGVLYGTHETGLHRPETWGRTTDRCAPPPHESCLSNGMCFTGSPWVRSSVWIGPFKKAARQAIRSSTVAGIAGDLLVGCSAGLSIAVPRGTRVVCHRDVIRQGG